MGHVTAIGEDHAFSTECISGRCSGGEWNRIVVAVDHASRNFKFAERGTEVEVITERVPHRLLGPAGDPERSQLAGARRIVEVSGDCQLEEPLLIGPEIFTAEPARLELLACGKQFGSGIPGSQRGLISDPFATGGRRRGDQRQRSHPLWKGHRVEHRQEAAPRVATEVKTGEPPDVAQRLQIVYLLAPPDGDVAGDRTLPPPTLVVIDQGAAASESVEAGQQIIVVRPGTAMQHDHLRTSADAALEQRRARQLPEVGGDAGQSNAARASAT